jgi:hypothetical protein
VRVLRYIFDQVNIDKIYHDQPSRIQFRYIFGQLRCVLRSKFFLRRGVDHCGCCCYLLLGIPFALDADKTAFKLSDNSAGLVEFVKSHIAAIFSAISSRDANLLSLLMLHKINND